METLPEPVNPDVVIREIPGRKIDEEAVAYHLHGHMAGMRGTYTLTTKVGLFT